MSNDDNEGRVMTHKLEEARSLHYFWIECGNLERWAGFDRSKLAAEFPAVLKAWDDYNASKLVLDAVIHHTLQRAEDEA